MSRAPSSRRSSKKRVATGLPDPTLRHVWLAGLGGIALAQRQASAGLGTLLHQVERMAGQVQANLAQARSQGQARVQAFSGEVEQRLAPVLVKLGLASAPAAKTRSRRKPAQVRKTAAKRTRRRA